MKEIASLDSLSIFGSKDSANRMKNQMFLDFSEVQPIFNVVKDTTFLNSSTFSRKKYNSAFIHHPSSIFLEDHRGLVLVSYFFSAPPRRLKRSKGIEAATLVSELAKRVAKSAKSFQNQQKNAFFALK